MARSIPQTPRVLNQRWKLMVYDLLEIRALKLGEISTIEIYDVEWQVIVHVCYDV